MYHEENDMEFEISQEERIAAELEDEREQALKIQLRQDERSRRRSLEPKDPPKKKKLKRELRREALTRLEEAARTQTDFDEVVAWWDKLDENRERRERDHEVLRGDVPLEYGAVQEGTIFPASLCSPFWRELCSGYFLNIIFICPYEMHELLLNQVVQNIFEIPHRYQVLFSLRALGMTLFFFILMYGFGMLRAAKVIRRRKVIDLLYDNQKNEEAGFQPLHRSVLTCLLSLAAMVAGVILLEKGLHIQTNEAMLYWGGACLLILAGVYELHRKIPMLLYQLAKRNPHRKYREETLFFLGQIGRRIQSSGRTMAVVAILLTVSLPVQCWPLSSFPLLTGTGKIMR